MNYLKLYKKVVAVTLLSFVFMFFVTQIGDFHISPTAEATLKSTVKSNSTTTLTTTVDTAGKSAVKIARDIGIVGLVIMIVWMGYSLFFKKSAEGLADMKGRLGLLIIAVAFVFFAEQILGAIFGIFGYTIKD